MTANRRTASKGCVVPLWQPILLLCFALCGPALGQDTEPVTIETKSSSLAEALDAKFRAAFKSGVSGAILLAENKNVTLRAGYGFANREQKIPFTTRTIAEIASITKQFTAMALIDLSEQGKVDFSKPVKIYLPQAAEPVASVTLDQLLTHRSGMSLYCGDDFARQSKATLLTQCAATKLDFAPGTKFQYSNPAYSILAAVVEEVSGEAIDAYLREHFFAPLGMNDTGSAFPDKPRDRFAVGYLNNKNQGVVDQKLAALKGDYWNLKGNGDFQASTEDMYRWFRALSGAGGISQIMRDTALKPRFYDAEKDNWIAYDWNVKKGRDGRVEQISHSGSDDTFLAYFCWRPADDRFFYFVSNSGTQAAAELVKSILASVRSKNGS